MSIILGVCGTVAALLAMAWHYTRRRLVLVAAVLWLAFPPYNYVILANCSGDCDIRVDLLLVAPILFGVSLLALESIARSAWRTRKSSRPGT
jgi:hypothetical protein